MRKNLGWARLYTGPDSGLRTRPRIQKPIRCPLNPSMIAATTPPTTTPVRTCTGGMPHPVTQFCNFRTISEQLLKNSIYKSQFRSQIHRSNATTRAIPTATATTGEPIPSLIATSHAGADMMDICVLAIRRARFVQTPSDPRVQN